MDFEQQFKRFDDILRSESGCSTALDYIEQTSWILFLKYLDDLEANRKSKIKVKLGPNQMREMWGQKTTSFYDLDGKPISATEFLKNIFGTLPDFFEDEEKLREIWSNPKTRKVFLYELKERGYSKDQLRECAKLINAENSDLFDVFEYIAFDKKPLTRGERILQAKREIFDGLDDKTKEFLEFVLNSYHKDGFEALSYDAFVDLLTIKYGSPLEAEMHFDDLNIVKTNFTKVQKKLYV